MQQELFYFNDKETPLINIPYIDGDRIAQAEPMKGLLYLAVQWLEMDNIGVLLRVLHPMISHRKLKLGVR